LDHERGLPQILQFYATDSIKSTSERQHYERWEHGTSCECLLSKQRNRGVPIIAS